MLIIIWTREKNVCDYLYPYLSLQSPYPLVLPTFSWHVQLAFTQDQQDEEIVLLWDQAGHIVGMATDLLLSISPIVIQEGQRLMTGKI